MDPFEPIFQSIYRLFFVPPNLKIRIDSVLNIPRWALLAAMFVSYFIFTSGIVYDMINNPPSIGVTLDHSTGRQVPQLVMPYRINGQYVMEGFTAALMFCVGSAGFLAVSSSASMSNISKRMRLIIFGAGAAGVVLAYNVLLSFLRLKVPGYLVR